MGKWTQEMLPEVVYAQLCIGTVNYSSEYNPGIGKGSSHATGFMWAWHHVENQELCAPKKAP